jgi:hypothetical protein
MKVLIPCQERTSKTAAKPFQQFLCFGRAQGTQRDDLNATRKLGGAKKRLEQWLRGSGQTMGCLARFECLQEIRSEQQPLVQRSHGSQIAESRLQRRKHAFPSGRNAGRKPDGQARKRLNVLVLCELVKVVDRVRQPGELALVASCTIRFRSCFSEATNRRPFSEPDALQRTGQEILAAKDFSRRMDFGSECKEGNHGFLFPKSRW